MIIHKTMQLVDLPDLSQLTPSIDYTKFNLSMSQVEIIESHGPWSDVAAWDGRLTQECESCGDHICITMRNDLFLILSVYTYGEKINPNVYRCNEGMIKE